MMPTSIPKRLRAGAYYFDSSEELPAWAVGDVPEVVAALDGTTVAVLSAEAYTLLHEDVLPSGQHWSLKSVPGESASTRAMRSRVGVVEFARSLQGTTAIWIALEFSLQDEAA